MNLIFIIFSIPYAFHFLFCFSKFILLLCKAEVEFAGSLTDVYTYLSRVTVLTCQSKEEKYSKKNVISSFSSCFYSRGYTEMFKRTRAK